jgi:hypothetical protein
MCGIEQTSGPAGVNFPPMTYVICGHISTETGLFTAVVCAIPKGEFAIAEIRKHECDSWEGAASLLDPMAQALGSELKTRGDRVIAVEIPT